MTGGMFTKSGRVRHEGPPPFIGWWNARLKLAPPSIEFDRWGWWDGAAWSMFARASFTPEQAGLWVTVGAGPHPDVVEWTTLWPTDPRVPRHVPAHLAYAVESDTWEPPRGGVFYAVRGPGQAVPTDLVALLLGRAPRVPTTCNAPTTCVWGAADLGGKVAPELRGYRYVDPPRGIAMRAAYQPGPPASYANPRDLGRPPTKPKA